MRIFNPQNQSGDPLLPVSAIKPLVISYLKLSEVVSEPEICKNAADTAIALFPEDEEIKYCGCKSISELNEMGFVPGATVDTLLTSLSIFEQGPQGFFDNVKVWKSNLPYLSAVTGATVFIRGPLEEFNGQLPNLKIGNKFLATSALTSWNIDLPNLTVAKEMFSHCSSLASVNATMPNLVNGIEMFTNCTTLSSFKSSLQSLLSADGMFSGCILDLESVITIANTIKDINGITYDASMQTDYDITEPTFGVITIGAAPITGDDTEDVAKKTTAFNEAILLMENKGWTVQIDQLS